MTCRHQHGDPNCSSHPKEPKTPDSYKYTIEDVEQIGEHLVLKVKYPNCNNCSYEGNKVIVFLNCSTKDALKWKKIDPHFRDPKLDLGKTKTEAPSPAARFPANPEGWCDAIAYAHGKCKSTTLS